MDDERALMLENHDRVRRAHEFQQSDGLHPMTKGFPKPVTVLMRDDRGQERRLTETQHRIIVFVRSHEGETFTATVIAHSLGVAISTVTRTVNLGVALRLIAVNVVRGRYGGIEILARAWADLKARSRNAWTRIRDTAHKAEERYLRKLDASHYFTAGLNFASIEDGRKIDMSEHLTMPLDYPEVLNSSLLEDILMEDLGLTGPCQRAADEIDIAINMVYLKEALGW